MDLIFVSSESDGGKRGLGKLTEVFFDRAGPLVRAKGGRIFRYPLKDFLKRRDKHQSGVLLLVYNELLSLDTGFEIEAAEKDSSGLVVVNNTNAGHIIGDKALSNRVFSAAGVQVPEPFDGIASKLAFSNAVRGSSRDVWLINQGEPLPNGRYNVRFIDTSQDFRGNKYYVSLRAMCVGTERYAIYVRARPVSEQNPSVHARNTPLDPDLIRHLHETVVVPRQSEIDEMCSTIGKVLGLGFYAHDILPENTGKIYLSEAGFKFDESSLRTRFLPVQRDIIYQELYGDETKRALESLYRQCMF